MKIDIEQFVTWLEHQFYESYRLTNYTCEGIYEDNVTEEMKVIDKMIRKIKHDSAIEEYENAVKGEDDK